MPTKLKVLVLEDRAEDAELAIHELRRAGYDPEWVRVETEPEYLARLGQGWDIILADYNLPEFNGMRALTLLRDRDPDLPFILVSGTIGEEKAVEALKAGANGYVMKDRLARLGPAVERELRDAVERHELKRAESQREAALEALEAERGLLRTLIDNLPDNIFIKDTEGRIILDNLAHRRLLGSQGLDEVIGKFDRDFFPPELADRYMNDERRIVESGRPLINYEEPVVDKEGRPYWYLTTKVPVHDSHGNITALVGINRDITERKRAEEALIESEERYRSLFENSVVGISQALPDGRLIFANNAYAQMYGYKNVAELMAKVSNVEQFYADPEDRQEMLRGLVEKGFLKPKEIVVVRRDGTRLTVLVGAREIRDAKGNLISYQAEHIDVSDRKKAEAILQETLLGLRKALNGIVQVLSAVSEIRDPYTAGHQRRVGDLAQRIARELGLAPARVEGIRVAGVIHDIGKLSIPAEILSKPGRLTKFEYELIKSHPQIGHDILGGIDFAWPIADMVLEHHERMDGSGYPQGLKGDAILLEARILAVADVIEAMASHRPYRPALGIEAALEEIEKNKGLLYDPDVVSTCLTLFRQQRFCFGEISDL